MIKSLSTHLVGRKCPTATGKKEHTTFALCIDKGAFGSSGMFGFFAAQCSSDWIPDCLFQRHAAYEAVGFGK